MIEILKEGAIRRKQKFMTVCKECGVQFNSCQEDWTFIPAQYQMDANHWRLECPTQGCRETLYKYTMP